MGTSIALLSGWEGFLRSVRLALETLMTIKGTSINCRERPEDKADGTQKPECTQST